MTILTQSGALGVEDSNIIPETSADQFIWTAPGMIRKLTEVDSFENTAITGGGLSTTDTRQNPSVFFLTIARRGPDDNVSIGSYFDGFGVALIPISEEDYANGRFNLYIVDNEPAAREVILGEKLHTGWGDYGYLAATSVPFYATTVDDSYFYNFELLVDEDNALRFSLWESTSLKPASPSITYGAHVPSGEGSYWGVSTSRTDGYKWRVGNMALWGRGEKYGVLECKLSTENISETAIVKAHAYASGYNSDDVTDDAGVSLFIKNQETGLWEEKDSNESSVGGESALLDSGELLLSTYATASIPQRIEATVAPAYPSSYGNGYDSIVNVDYIWAESWDAAVAHIGGKSDVYIEEGTLPTLTYIDLYNTGTIEFLVPSNTKIQDVADFIQPILWVSEIESLDINGDPTGVYLSLNSDYSFSCENPNYRFSIEETIKIILTTPNQNIRVHYYTYSNINAAQIYCDESLHRNITNDILAKAKQPLELFITMTATTTLLPPTIRGAISQYLTQAEDLEVTFATLEALVLALEGVSAASITSVTQRLHEIDGSTEDTELTEKITRTNIQQFCLVDDAEHIEIG